jgi:glycosyltransferase involved in cell wall biosynthesis
LKQAAQLQALGHRVVVLTTMPHAPLGRVFDGYRHKLYMREVMDGVEVVRVWSIPAPCIGILRRVVSHLSFAVASLFAGLRITRPDLIISSVPNVGTEMSGYLLSRIRRCRFLLEMRDLIPDNLALVGSREGAPFYRVLKFYFRFFYRRSDFVAVTGPGMRERLIDYGAPEQRVLLLPHAADPSHVPAESTESLRTELGLRHKFVVLYSGSFSVYYDLSTVVRAAIQVRALEPRVHFLLLGTGRERQHIEAMLKTLPNENITLHDAVPPDQVARYVELADVTLSPYVACRPVRMLRGNFVTKIVQYLYAGKPVIALERADAEMAGPVLESVGAGVRIEPGSPRSLADAVLSFANDPIGTLEYGRRAAAYARECLTRERVVARFERELCERLRCTQSRESGRNRPHADSDEPTHQCGRIGVGQHAPGAATGVQQPQAHVIRSP